MLACERSNGNEDPWLSLLKYLIFITGNSITKEVETC